MSHEALQSKEEIMKKKIAVLVPGVVSPAATSFAGSTNPVVGGREMYPTKDVADNAVNSADHTTLTATVKAAAATAALVVVGAPR